MSAAMRLPAIAGALTTTAAIVGLLSLPSVRDYLSRNLGSNISKTTLRLTLLLLAYINLKNLPGLWHFRVLRGIVYQLYFQPTAQKPRHLFAPLITSSRNSLYDTDYNIHKSNSTYFADLDVARAHLISCIIRTGLSRLNRGDEEGLSEATRSAPGRYTLALGAVACFFHKQIELLQEFDVLTRVLAWDRKWIYCVSHIVKKGSVKPEKYVLQPWKKDRRRSTKDGKGEKTEEEGEDFLKKNVFATSVARYVFKKGRLTINPEVILERSRLLPPRPAGVSLPPRAEASASASSGITPAETPATPAGAISSPEAVASRVSEKLGSVADKQQGEDDEGWTWDDMERERLRGLKIASHFESLSDAHGELRGGEVLGQYGDYW